MYKSVIYFFFITVIIAACTDSKTGKQSSEYAIDSNELVFQNRLKTIEENYKRINAVSTWERIDSVDLHESTEGGAAIYYRLNNKLEKIIAIYFGETFKTTEEYYLLNGQLSFTLETSLKYNRPIYWDSTQMKENNDTEVFDPSKSEVTENRNYFENGEIIHRTNNQDCGALDAREFVIQEQERMKKEYKKYLSLIEE